MLLIQGEHTLNEQGSSIKGLFTHKSGNDKPRGKTNRKY